MGTPQQHSSEVTMISFVSLLCLLLATGCHAALPGENCVDISRYQELEFNHSEADLCTFSVVKECQPKWEKVCITVEETVCRVEAAVEETVVSTDHVVPNDSIVDLEFVEKVCKPKPVKPVEKKMMPQCEMVTKEQCDSKWVINAEGEKVWAGNENCKNVTWQDCKLQEVEVSEEVISWECEDGEAIKYAAPVQESTKVSTMETQCAGEAYEVCETSQREVCTDVDWQECSDRVVTKCFPGQFEEPFQRYDHRLRCTVQH